MPTSRPTSIAVAALLLLALASHGGAAQPAGRDSRLAEADARFAEAMRLWPGGPSPEIEQLLLQVLAEREAVLGPRDPSVARARDQLGRLHYNLRQNARAEALFRQAADIAEAALGPRDLTLAEYLGDLGAALRELHRHDEAEATVRRSLEIRRTLLPANDPAIAGSLNNLGRNYLAQGRGAEAGQMFEQARTIYQRHYGAEAPITREQVALIARAAETGRKFDTVFDIRWSGYKSWWVPAFGVIFVLLGWLQVCQPALLQTLMPAGLQGRPRRIVGWLFLVFALLLTAGSFVLTYGAYRQAALAMASGRASVVEGPVSEFKPMPYAGHAEESFRVGSSRFAYSDYLISAGFNTSRSHGGPIEDGRYVRITHVGNTILRLDIAR